MPGPPTKVAATTSIARGETDRITFLSIEVEAAVTVYDGIRARLPEVELHTVDHCCRLGRSHEATIEDSRRVRDLYKETP
jgi:hypothetical protein